jgi:hypothetical protein
VRARRKSQARPKGACPVSRCDGRADTELVDAEGNASSQAICRRHGYETVDFYEQAGRRFTLRTIAPEAVAS